MAEKTLSTRIIHKHDVESNWLLATNFTPKQGELIVYDIDSNYSYERFKIGDGVRNVNTLPFATDALQTSIETQLSTLNSEVDAVSGKVDTVSAFVGDTEVSLQIEEAVADKADISAGTYTITATSEDGIAYAATVPGITALTAGASFIMIPGLKSNSITPTLNVNGLGTKGLRRRLSANAMSLQKGPTVSWLLKGKPFRIVYDGQYWVVEDQNKPMASDLYGYFSSVLVKDRINGYGYILEMQDGKLVSSSCCKSISVTTLPTKTQYVNGESFDSTGMVVTATCEDGSTKIINNAMCECNPTMAVGEVTVVVSYTECNVEYTDSFVINVT